MDEFDRVAVSNLEYACSLEQERLENALPKSEYMADRYAHVHLHAVEEFFKCANKECLNDEVECLWYKSKFVDLGVYHNWAEFFCPKCQTYTFIEHQRDSSKIIGKMKELATITLLEDDHLRFKYAETGEETTINMRLIGALWNLKMKLVELFLPELRWDQIDVLNPPELVKERGKTMLNEKFPSVWLELGVPFKVVRRPRGLKANQRMELLRFHHSGGRWGQDLADGELNSTGDLAIISYEKDDEDHMFSSSLDIKWWIYEMATMRELKVDGMPELKYSMLINSLGQREQGIDNVTFHPEKPNTVLVHFDKEPGGTVPPPFEMNFEPEACP